MGPLLGEQVNIDSPADLDAALDRWHLMLETIMCEMISMRVKGKAIAMSPLALATTYNDVADQMRVHISRYLQAAT